MVICNLILKGQLPGDMKQALREFFTNLRFFFLPGLIHHNHQFGAGGVREAVDAVSSLREAAEVE